MKKSSKPVLAVGLILAGLVCIFAIPLLAGSSAWAASPAGLPMLAQAAPGQTAPGQAATQAPTGSHGDSSPITGYLAQGYSVVGPHYVALVSPQSIVLQTGAKDLGIDLVGKKLVVIDQNSRTLTLSAAQKGKRVAVCRKENNVVVVVLPDKELREGVNE
jgi:hypothetical protein